MGLTSKVIPLKLFCRHCIQFFRRFYWYTECRMFSWRISLCRFFAFSFKAKQNLQRSGHVFLHILITSKSFLYIFWLQARELRFSVCFDTFRNFNRSLNKRRMYPAQTITTEWTAQKCLEKLEQRNESVNGTSYATDQTDGLNKVQGDDRISSSKKQFK